MFRAFSFLIAGALAGALCGLSAQAAQPAPSDFAARCQSGGFSLKSPADVFQAHHLDITKACPFQTEVDKAHECQDAATVLQNMYDLLKDEHAKTCAAASAAVDKAQQNCQGQDSCLEAQRAALKAYQNAITGELKTLKDYADQADTSLNYALHSIAKPAVQLLNWVKEDAAKPEDQGVNYGPNGRDGTAGWLHANSNQDALSNARIFNQEDPTHANAVVQRFIDNKASASDLSGIKSSLIREPLEVVQAGREWKQDLLSYQKNLETQTNSLGVQTASLAKNTTGLGNVDTSGNRISSLTSGASSGVLPAAAAAAPALGALSGLGGAAGAQTGSAATAGGDPAASAPAAYPTASADSAPGPGDSSGRGGRPQATSNGGDGTSGKVPGTSSPAPVDLPDAASPRLAKVATLQVGGNAGTSTSGKSGRAAGGTAASRSGAGAGTGGGKGKPGDGSGPDAGTSAASAADGGAGSPGDRSPSSGSPFSADLLGAGALGLPAGTQDSNEKAVKKIVGEWENTLLPGSAGGNAGPEEAAASPEILGDESLSLFSRVKVAHLRALQRGSLMRSPSRL